MQQLLAGQTALPQPRQRDRERERDRRKAHAREVPPETSNPHDSEQMELIPHLLNIP